MSVSVWRRVVRSMRRVPSCASSARTWLATMVGDKLRVAAAAAKDFASATRTNTDMLAKRSIQNPCFRLRTQALYLSPNHVMSPSPGFQCRGDHMKTSILIALLVGILTAPAMADPASIAAIRDLPDDWYPESLAAGPRGADEGGRLCARDSGEARFERPLERTGRAGGFQSRRVVGLLRHHGFHHRADQTERAEKL